MKRNLVTYQGFTAKERGHLGEKRRVMKRILLGQRGFTLVEILIAVGILAILAGIAVPVVSHLTGSSQTSSARAELSNVQAAVDSLMADQDLASLPNPVTSATSNMAQFPDWQATSPYGYVLRPATNYRNSDTDKFIRQSTTKGTYTAEADGTVTQASTGY